MESRNVMLNLTTEQEETIKALFAHNGWDYKEIQQDTGNKRIRKQREQTTTNEQSNDEERGELFRNTAENACEHCFQAPCVTDRAYAWLGAGQAPCNDNSSIRRAKYSSYWKVLSNLGAWNDPRYLQVKQARANGGEWAVCHRREVMPHCILRQIRTLYPNPKDVPYMDHKWE